MPGLEDRVDSLEATTAKLCTCMREIHHTLNGIQQCMREDGQYMDADLCEHCHGILEEFKP